MGRPSEKSYLDFDDLEDMFDKGWRATARTGESWVLSITSGDYAGHTVQLSGSGFSTTGTFPTSGTISSISVLQGATVVLAIDDLAMTTAAFAAEADIRVGRSRDDEEKEPKNRDDDLLHGGDHNDDVGGGIGDDRIFGHRGRDRLHGGSGKDHLDGGDDDDDVEGGIGNDIVSGGRGSDRVRGGDGRDSLKGGEDDDSVEGGSGDDRVDGGNGNDDLDGGLGNDTIVGGAGDDTVHYDDSDTAVTVDLSHRMGRGEGRDVLSGIEHVHGSGKADRLSGDANGNALSGDDGRDRIQGAGGNDTLDGGGNRDDLDGGDGNDVLLGGADADKLAGKAGADILDGGEGSDVLTGGAGNDTFVFSGEFGRDVVKDFGKGDVLDLRGWAATHGVVDFDDLQHYLDDGSSLVIRLSDDSTVKLAGVSAAELLPDSVLL